MLLRNIFQWDLHMTTAQTNLLLKKGRTELKKSLYDDLFQYKSKNISKKSFNDDIDKAFE